MSLTKITERVRPMIGAADTSRAMQSQQQAKNRRAPCVCIAVTVPWTFIHCGEIPSMLVARGWRVIMVASTLPPEGERVEGVLYRAIAMHRGVSPIADAVAIVRWVAFLLRERPDGVIASTPKASFLVLVASRICGVRRRQWLVRGCRWDRERGLRAWLARLGDRVASWCATDVVAVSHGLRALLESKSIAVGRVRVLGAGGSRGVDTVRYAPRLARSLHTSPTIGFAGRLAHDKGLDWLPALLRAVLCIVPDARLLIAGGSDNADPGRIETIRELQGMACVKLLGSVSDMPEFYRSIDVLCFPSLREGLPNAVIEAAACGVPTVAWDATGVSDAVLQGETGYVLPMGDINAMAEKISTILTSADERERLAVAARRFAEENFSADLVQARYVEHLEHAWST